MWPRTLYTRIVLALFSVMALTGIVYVLLSLYAARHYLAEIDQLLNRDLAKTLVAGGGLKHGTHIAVDRNKSEMLLGDLYITLMQQLGLEAKRFSNAKRDLNHLIS